MAYAEGPGPPPPSEREPCSYAGNSGSALAAWRHFFWGAQSMFEDDGCAAFGRLGQGTAGLGPIGEVDGESAQALAVRWAARYSGTVVLTEEEGGFRVEPGMTEREGRAHG